MIDSRRERNLETAIAVADAIRRDHNGIMSVEIHLGHDGDNTVTLRDYDRVLAKESCGRDEDGLLISLTRAVNVWRFGKFWGFHEIVAVAADACRIFCATYTSRIFNTANFVSAVRNAGFDVVDEQHKDLVELLDGCPRIVRLKGGCHWYLLPDDLERDSVA